MPPYISPVNLFPCTNFGVCGDGGSGSRKFGLRKMFAGCRLTGVPIIID